MTNGFASLVALGAMAAVVCTEVGAADRGGVPASRPAVTSTRVTVGRPSAAATRPAATRAAAARAAAETVADVPGLPRVLVIGDSISIGYTPVVRRALAGKANVHHSPGNAATSAYALANLDAWLGGKGGDEHWDLVYVNVGLHDVKLVDGKHQVEPAEYETNLKAIAARLNKSGAAVVFADTTPVPEGSAARTAGVELPYNQIADRVMADAGVPTDDLHAVVTPHQADWQLPRNVHYNAEGYEELGQHVARTIAAVLRVRRPAAGGAAPVATTRPAQ